MKKIALVLSVAALSTLSGCCLPLDICLACASAGSGAQEEINAAARQDAPLPELSPRVRTALTSASLKN